MQDPDKVRPNDPIKLAPSRDEADSGGMTAVRNLRRKLQQHHITTGRIFDFMDDHET